MYINKYGGMLVAIDGPNGVGKSTLISGVQNILMQNKVQVLVTKEPSSTPLGEFTRNNAENIDGNSLACLVASDRYYHLKNEIIPHLEKGYIVLMDRYVLSSLILQRMDSVDLDFILAINSNILKPDLQFAISADSDVIQQRLQERDILTRFERGNKTNKELQYLDEGINCLTNLGINVFRLSNNNDLERNSLYITEEIENFFRR
ncbi:MAG: dTMP kinase [Oscillospiraceae bacterium]|nr:dTMP kinase [Oscillospiraceae bacterium]